MAAMWVSLCRLRAFCSSPASLLRSRGIRVTGPGYETDIESEDDELRDIKSALKRQKKAILFQQIKRQMEPRGPPERSLTWAAMEQIRYLNQELPEEWTVPRLAEGFSVSTNVISRVLRTKFSPPEKRRIKQDAKVSQQLVKIPQGSTRDLLQLTPSANDPAHELLPPGRNEKKLQRTQTAHLMQPPEKLHLTGNPVVANDPAHQLLPPGRNEKKLQRTQTAHLMQPPEKLHLTGNPVVANDPAHQLLPPGRNEKKLQRTQTAHLMQPPEKLHLTGNPVVANDPAHQLLPPGRNEKKLQRTQTAHLMQPPGKQHLTGNPASLVVRAEKALAHRNKENLKLSTQLSHQKKNGIVPAVTLTTDEDHTSSVKEEQMIPDEEWDGEVVGDSDPEEWDGEVISDSELEEFSTSGSKNSMKVVQKGREFFDTDGDFLYRI